ncbi:MAG TPA: acyltransferase [Gemmatimonadaceae bacterium]|nr:acyltransferase [Gemmatimonadaceae bacterium]
MTRGSPVAPQSRVASAPRFGGHLPALDGLRGLAVLLVMVFHFVKMAPANSLDAVIARAASVTWTGVELFFVLSGFLITGILYDAKGGAHYFRNFYMRRALRIFPLYYGALVLLFVVLPSVVSWEPLDELRAQQVWFWTYTLNILKAITGDDGILFTGHFWSLAVEEQFYLVWPFVVYALPWDRLVKLCVAIIAGSLALRVGLLATDLPALASYVLMPARMDTLALGGLIALVVRRPGGFAQLVKWAPPVAVTAAVVLAAGDAFGARLHFLDPWTRTVGFTAFAFLFGALLVLVLAARPGEGLGRVGFNPFMQSLGKYSYAIYVIHFPVRGALGYFGFDVLDLPIVAGSRLPAQLVFFVVASAISYVLAWLSWHLYEKHFLKLKDLFPYRGQTASVPAEAARMPGI